MESKEASNNIRPGLIEDVSDLIEELSDQEAGACVGGLYVDGRLLGVTNEIVEVNAEGKLLGLDTKIDNNPFGSLRVTRSDRNQKEHFASVDVQEILEKVVTLPIETWNYTDQNPTIRHIGPMAQDFAAAFSVGEDNRLINTVDANGVALAAIQGLYKLLQQKDAQISAMRAELDDLKQQMLASKENADQTQVQGTLPRRDFSTQDCIPAQ
ncbi:MAG TPA: tail fiber domain-containing protein [Coleofasciculaceae cyanobacterium]